MKWKTIADPAYSVHHAEVDGRFYKIQHKKGMALWRLFLKEVESQPLRTIYTGTLLRDCKEYAAIYEESFK